MVNNTAFIIPFAFPDTIVRVSNEWYIKHIHYLGVGKKDYLKAGHAAFILIEKETGLIEYFDFGRYITPEPYGRVRSAITDNELTINFKAEIKNDAIVNLEAILIFFATKSKLTHGQGRLITTVCSEVNYIKAKEFIANIQANYLVPYSAFKKNATNCARFVTDVLLASLQNNILIKKLNKTKLFTPSPIGNVLAVSSATKVFEVSNSGDISIFKNKKSKEIISCFFDPIKSYKSNFQGNLEPKIVNGLSKKAQWLSGIGSGAWFELFETEIKDEFIFKRTSGFGTVDVLAVFKVDNASFDINKTYKFNYHSNCSGLLIHQNNRCFKFVSLV